MRLRSPSFMMTFTAQLVTNPSRQKRRKCPSLNSLFVLRHGITLSKCSGVGAFWSPVSHPLGFLFGTIRRGICAVKPGVPINIASIPVCYFQKVSYDESGLAQVRKWDKSSRLCTGVRLPPTVTLPAARCCEPWQFRVVLQRVCLLRWKCFIVWRHCRGRKSMGADRGLN